ncbi:histone methyltransferase set2 [Scheffersomyces spartinae]|uniref:Histone-lysine N-methyltransferase, H3 lysine-36 specific n=1 Tax=Scheffersomyces spartinae TaxID=45513 RepID=A0A9P8AGS0_9ASCO|nr:histone methyltransferase set2 [Scheffersomyces spartinae]KAG7191352.1 histone methyltransferase set2 [Scheffersomyces spartinae]
MTDVKSRQVQLYLDAESKTEEARSKFEELAECTYGSKNLGSSGQVLEYMSCDCVEQWDSEQGINLACGEDSDCINRVTSVECINKHCASTCGKNCSNQRFQKKQYAPVTVFQTEKKGYGLRADKELSEGQFIYEYIGEVIDEKAFRQRMIEYDTKNFKHFYFMMLNKDSFIDATLKGSLARFVNHSCSPNAFVDKWVVGEKLRMGIFAKRSIAVGEEITFDYNVDRYGAQKQPCYCGEPNCIKFMGGKTQTDAAMLLPEGVSEALGVTTKMERAWVRENKHKLKTTNEDSGINEDFVNNIPMLSLLQPVEVSKVMGALMKNQDVLIASKLIERLFLTNDDNINLAIIRFHGYKTFSKLIEEYRTIDSELSQEILTKILKILGKWPKVTKNKISSSQIEDVIRKLKAASTNEEIQTLAQSLLDEWSTLLMAYRIPKYDGNEAYNHSPIYGRGTRSPEQPSMDGQNYNNSQKQESLEFGTYNDADGTPLPDGWQMAIDKDTGKPYYFHTEKRLSKWERPVSAIKPQLPKGPKFVSKEINGRGGREGSGTPRSKHHEEEELARREEDKLRKEKEMLYNEVLEKEKRLQELIQQSQKGTQAGMASSVKSLSSNSNGGIKNKQYKSLSHRTPSTESQWMALFAKYVPNLLRLYEAEIGRENMKKCAKDLVHQLAQKEVKRDAEKTPPSEFVDSKVKKIKESVKLFMEKYLVKYRKKHDKRKHESSENNQRKRVKTDD